MELGLLQIMSAWGAWISHAWVHTFFICHFLADLIKTRSQSERLTSKNILKIGIIPKSILRLSRILSLLRNTWFLWCELLSLCLLHLLDKIILFAIRLIMIGMIQISGHLRLLSLRFLNLKLSLQLLNLFIFFYNNIFEYSKVFIHFIQIIYFNLKCVILNVFNARLLA